MISAAALPAVPVPPTDLSAPRTASTIFLVLCLACTAAAIVYVATRWRGGDRLGLMFLLGGLLSGMLEPMLDYLGLLWFAADNVAIALETFHRHVPLYVVLGYAFYFGGLSYVAYRAFLAGKGQRWFWAFFAVDWMLDFALQATGRGLGLYEYYGPQPLLILDVPAWWFTIDSTMPVLCGGLIYLMRHQLVGWRQLAIIPLVPACYAGLNAAAGWPVFSALNTGPSTVVVWLAGIATCALAIFYRWLMIEVVVRARARELGEAPLPSPAPAGRPAPEPVGA